MPTLDIPRDSWAEALQAFSKQHDGWIVDLEIFGPAIGDQMEAHDLPLDGISADLRHYGGEITIAIGDRPDRHLVHAISAPSHVRLKQSDDGRDEVLEIVSEGVTALLSLRSPFPADDTEQIPEQTR